MAGSALLTLYARPGCHLCEDMAAALREMDLDFETVNIEENAETAAAYADAIPVLSHDGVEIARAPQSPRTLKRALQRAGVL